MPTLWLALAACIPRPTTSPAVTAEPTCDRPPIEPTETSYPVVGDSHEALRRAIRDGGPGDGRVSLTTASLRWSCTDRVVGEERTLGWVRADVRIEVLLPEWQPPDGASADLRADWAAFLVAQREHEAGHVRIADAWLRCLEEEVRAEATCAAAYDRAERRMGSMEAEQAAYDAHTQHGIAQGSVL